LPKANQILAKFYRIAIDPNWPKFCPNLPKVICQGMHGCIPGSYTTDRLLL